MTSTSVSILIRRAGDVGVVGNCEVHVGDVALSPAINASQASSSAWSPPLQEPLHLPIHFLVPIHLHWPHHQFLVVQTY